MSTFMCRECNARYSDKSIGKCYQCESELSLAATYDDRCFICQNENSQHESIDDFDRYDCPFCGTYYISKELSSILQADSSRLMDFGNKAPAMAVEMKQRGLDGYRLVANEHLEASIGSLPFLSSYPTDFDEIIDRSLINLFIRARKPFSMIKIPIPLDRHYLFSPRDADATSVIDALTTLGYIEESAFSGEAWHTCLTLQGWRAGKKLLREWNNSNKVFIAMWFNDIETGFLRKMMRDVVERQGYKVIVIDEDHHDGYIMERVLNRIRESRFVIADFTCQPECSNDKGQVGCGVRGGVYFEAGYAKGMGKTLIATCRNDDASRSRLHFDVQQLNTIFWKEVQEDGKTVLKVGDLDFQEVLKERILALEGEFGSIQEKN